MAKRDSDGKARPDDVVFAENEEDDEVDVDEEEDEDEEESGEEGDEQSGDEEEGSDDEEVDEEDVEEEDKDGDEADVDNGIVMTADDWKNVLTQGDENLADLVKRKIPVPFEQKNAHTVADAPWEPTEPLHALIKGFFLYLSSSGALRPKQIKAISSAVFARVDVLTWVAKAAAEHFKSFDGVAAWKNAFTFIKSAPLPSDNTLSQLFEGQGKKLSVEAKPKQLAKALEEYVLALTKQELPTVIALSLMTWLAGPPLAQLPRPQLVAQFYFAHFARGSTQAIFALEGLLQLVIKHNFEYPKLFEEVYALTTPSSFYLNHKKKFIDILDLFLSSTHLSTYIVASFIKKMSRCLLYAPFDVQESLMGLIRNGIARHPTVTFLIQREAPDTVESDPFDEDEMDLRKTGALESSLWEIKTLQAHWLLPVAKRARFIDAGLRKTEGFVRYLDPNGYWNDAISKAYGEELVKMKTEYQKEHNDMYAHVDELKRKVPIVETAPDGHLFPKKTFLIDYESVWSL